MILDQICKCEGRPLDGKQPFLDRNDLDPGRDLQAFGCGFSEKQAIGLAREPSCPCEALYLTINISMIQPLGDLNQRRPLALREQNEIAFPSISHKEQFAALSPEMPENDIFEPFATVL